MTDESWSEHNSVQVSSEEAQEKADRLAPLEERKEKPGNQKSDEAGLIRIDTGDLKLPSDFTEKREGKSRLFGLEPLTLFILIFSLAFIGFIAYLIYTEPAKAVEAPAVERQP